MIVSGRWTTQTSRVMIFQEDIWSIVGRASPQTGLLANYSTNEPQNSGVWLPRPSLAFADSPSLNSILDRHCTMHGVQCTANLACVRRYGARLEL